MKKTTETDILTSLEDLNEIRLLKALKEKLNVMIDVPFLLRTEKIKD